MKILLIGSSSDIAQHLVENANSDFEFIDLRTANTRIDWENSPKIKI